MDWLQEHYADFEFYLERDVAWTVQKHIAQAIKIDGFPYQVVHEYTLNGLRVGLVILNEGTVEVVMEFKYEPHRSRSVAGKFPVTVWKDIVKDVQKNIERIKQGKVAAAYSVFIDEGGHHYRGHQSAPERSEWRDWGQGRWVLWSQTSQREDGTPRAAVERSTEIASTVARGGGVTASWTPLPDWDPNLSELPVTLGFPDGSERKARQWNHLLREVAAWLWTTEHLTNDNLPVPSGPTNYIVNDTPYHSTGRKFDDPKEAEGTPLFVETNTGGREEIKRVAEKLLKHCGVEPRSILVKN